MQPDMRWMNVHVDVSLPFCTGDREQQCLSLTSGKNVTPGQAFKQAHLWENNSILHYLCPQNQSFSGYVHVLLCLWNYIYTCTDTE